MEKEIINKRLSELKTSEEGVITKVFGHGSFRNRITEMGFVRGKTVRVIKNAPLSDPIEYEIMGYRIALRKSEAELIEVSLPGGGTAGSRLPSGGTFRNESVNRFQHVAGRTINIALVGNPNSGKTSLFNVASGSHERVGNYSGVTVDAKQAVFRQDGYTFNLFDLPGTYSITEYTPEELYVRRHILEAMPDVVINVLDASNLERNLFLTTQLIDMDLKVVIALNMYDELEKSGLKLDYHNLGRMIGIPIVPTVASRGEGIRELFKTAIDVFEDNEPIVRHIHINYGKDIEQSIRLLQDEIWKNTDLVARYSSRYLAIKLLCDDKNGYEVVESAANFAEIGAVAEHERQKLERQYKDSVETIITDAKFGFIAGALEETCQGINLRKNRPDDRVDRIMTHKVWGLPIFLLIMWIMFQTTFSLGGIPAGWLEAGVEWLGDFIGGIMREGPLRELIVNGIISGVGGVIVFLPNILILFFFISLMEDTGYMARAAFIMDKLMHKIGLHGKSFIPLLMGFGCNVPAIMATRTLESRPADDHADHSVHVVQRPAAGLRPADLRLFPVESRAGAVLDLPDRHPDRHRIVHPVQKIAVRKSGGAVRHGTSALPDTDHPQRRPPHVEQRIAVPAEDGNGHSGCIDHHLGPRILSAQRRIFGRLRPGGSRDCLFRPVVRRRASETAGTE